MRALSIGSLVMQSSFRNICWLWTYTTGQGYSTSLAVSIWNVPGQCSSGRLQLLRQSCLDRLREWCGLGAVLNPRYCFSVLTHIIGNLRPGSLELCAIEILKPLPLADSIMSYERLANTQVHTRYKRNYLFRSLGLELPTVLRLGSPAKQEPKPVYRVSLKAALSNSAIHILPILASLTAVILNLKTIYLGRTLTGQIRSAAVNIAMLQVTAKLVELLIVASLTNIVGHRLRKEMVMGDGVPLRAISGTFMFSSLSYFWSPELWGSFQSELSPSAKIRIFGILILSGLLAVTIGPSTAVLLIPKDQDWNAGGSDIYLRGSPEEVWPSQVGFSPLGVEPFCSSPNAINYAVCPSGGYLSMLPYRTTAFKRHNLPDIHQNLLSFVFGSSPILMPSTFDQMPGVSLLGNWRSFACETSMTGIHVAEAIYLSQLLGDWHQIVLSIPYAPLTTSTSEYKYSSVLTGTTSS